LDDMVKKAYRPAEGPFGHPLKTSQSDAIKSVRDGIRDALKSAGETMPGTKDGPYAVAAKIAGDSISADKALEFGRKAFDTDPRLLVRGLRGMTSDDRELARIGLVEKLREKIDKAGFTHNAILKIFSSREDVNRIRPFFRREEDWQAFRKTIFNEARRRKTFDTMRGNSTTAKQLNDMVDAGRLGETAGVAASAATGGLLSGAVNMAVNAARRVSGITPETANRMAKVLMARDPQVVQQILSRLSRIEASKAGREEKANAIRQIVTAVIAGQEGKVIGLLNEQ
jgi:hypothetical protein